MRIPRASEFLLFSCISLYISDSISFFPDEQADIFPTPEYYDEAIIGKKKEKLTRTFLFVIILQFHIHELADLT
jgi:hypothetical protein